MPQVRVVFHCWIHNPRKSCFKSSHLCYADTKHIQYQAIVKLLGSFRLTAGNRHLHRYCIFTEQIPETVLQSLYHSCTSELTRQGISLFVPILRRTISSTFLRKCHCVWSLRDPSPNKKLFGEGLPFRSSVNCRLPGI